MEQAGKWNVIIYGLGRITVAWMQKGVEHYLWKTYMISGTEINYSIYFR